MSDATDLPHDTPFTECYPSLYFEGPADPRRPVGDPQHMQEVVAESDTEGLGLHPADFNFGMGDLLRIVETQDAAGEPSC